MDNTQQRKKVHITLVGAQAAPVYNGIIAIKPDVVEFIYSKKTCAAKDRVIAEIKTPVAPSEPLSDTNLHEILARAEDVAKKYTDCDVTLNIAGGLKPWSHFFAKIFSEYNKDWTIFYIDQNNVVWDLTRLTSWQADIPFDIPKYFRLQGTPLSSYYDLRDFSVPDTKTMHTVEEMHRQRQIHRIYMKMFANDDEDLQKAVNENPSGCRTSKYDNKSYIQWEPSECDGWESTKIKICLYDAHDNPYVYELDSPYAVPILFCSGWYEYKVAKALSKWEHADKVWMNCKFRTRDNKEDKNEVDIIISTGKKLIFVECKTQIHNPSDMDKFCTAMKNYGGMASKGLFVTSWPKTEVCVEKCDDHNFIDITLWKDTPDKMKPIYSILNKELNTINSR